MHSAVNPRPTPEDTAVRYTLEASSSRFRIQAFASGILSAFGHNPVILIREFSGEAYFDPQALSASSLHLTIDPHSFEIENDLSAKDRNEILRTIHGQVIETEVFPEIQYRSNRVSGNAIGEGRFWVVLDGELTMHGVARPQKVAASVIFNDATCRASGEFALRQSDFGIRLVSAVAGGLRVKDEIKCSFDIIARRME